jgi:uncharacterized membrane protein/glutaredoxin
MRVTIYTKPGCHLCEDALDLLDKLTPQYGLEVEQANILDDMALYEAMHEQIPVIVAEDGQYGRLVAPISEPELRAYLEVARREGRYGRSVLPAYKESFLDRTARWIGKHWLKMAPVFFALGWQGVSDPIYTAYALTCHQLPERAGTVFGYQVAFCYRNTAIYGGFIVFGALYGLARDRHAPRLQWLRKPLPWWLFAAMLLPMAGDGLTHMLGLRDTMLDMTEEANFGMFTIGSQPFSLNWWLRVITGFLAACGAVWFAFPRMDRAVAESEAQAQIYRMSALNYPPGMAQRV